LVPPRNRPLLIANLLIADHWMALWISPACFRG
jgi:hypothetical protein